MGRQLFPNTERGARERPKDFFLGAEFKTTSNPLLPDYVNFTINQAERAFEERNNSSVFKLHGNVSLTTPLRNLTFTKPNDFDSLPLEQKQAYDYSDLSVFSFRSTASTVNDLVVNITGTIPFSEFDFSANNWQVYVGYFGSSSIIEESIDSNPNLTTYSKNLHLLPVTVSFGENTISRDLYSNKNYNFYVSDVDLTNFTDYLNRPLTDLFLVYIKNVNTNFLTYERKLAISEEKNLEIASPTLQNFEFTTIGVSSNTKVERTTEEFFTGNFSLKQFSGNTDSILNYDFTLARDYNEEPFTLTFLYKSSGFNTTSLVDIPKTGFNVVITNFSFTTTSQINGWNLVTVTCNLTANQGSTLRLIFTIQNNSFVYYDNFTIVENDYSNIIVPFVPNVETCIFDRNIFQETEVLESRQIVNGLGRIGISGINPLSSFEQRSITDPLSLLNQVDSDILNLSSQTNSSLTKFSFKWYYKIPFRVFSDVVESYNTEFPVTTITPPNYAQNLKSDVGDTTTLVWRNVLPVGLIEPGTNTGVDYPFLNGSHYIFYKHNLTVLFDAAFTDLTGNVFNLIRPFDYNDFVLDTSTNVSTTEVQC